MSISSNITDLEKFFSDEVGYYTREVQQKLNQLALEVEGKIKSGDYRSRTGSLRRSIRVNFTNTSFGVDMNPYGYFLSFGVSGKNRDVTFGLTPEVATGFGLQPGYKFGSSNVWGIKARNFYPLDLEEQIINIFLKEE